LFSKISLVFEKNRFQGFLAHFFNRDVKTPYGWYENRLNGLKQALKTNYSPKPLDGIF